MTGASPPIRLHIDRLVLDGLRFDAGGAARFQAALITTLGELLRGDGLPRGIAGGAVPHVMAPPVAAPPSDAAASPEALGRAVARSVHAGLTGGGGQG